MTITLTFLITSSAFLISLIAIWFFKRFASKWAWVDAAGVDPLKIHAAPTPFVGGFGISFGSLAALLLYACQQASYLNRVLLIVGLGIGVALLGWSDDRFTVKPRVRLMIELVAGVGLAMGGFAFGLFPKPTMILSNSITYAVAAAFIVFVVVGAINAVNMQDGMDGLAGGVTLLSCIGFAWVGMYLEMWLVMILACGLGAALLAFLFYNFHPASVFMGDNGSYFVGFMVATLALTVSFARGEVRSLAGSILLIGVPVFDAAFAIARRMRRGVSPFTGDRSHFYDYLAKRGLTTRQVAGVSYALQTLFVGLGILLIFR